MAFEAFRKQDRGSNKLRRVVIGVAAIFHGALIAAGVVYSYWHVDELTPPTLRVTFISATPPPPPPPPPPPAGGGPAKKKVAFKPKTPTPVVVPRPTEIVQPREKPAPVKKTFRQHEDEEEDEDEDAPKGAKGGIKGGIEGGEAGGVIGGTVGGTQGGTIGGTIGGTGAAAPSAPKFLPPNIGAGQKVTGADPPFPITLRRGDTEYVVRTKVCVSRTGSIDSVTLMKKADPLLDDSVVNTVKTWRYRPYMANNMPVPWCTFVEFQFKSQH